MRLALALILLFALCCAADADITENATTQFTGRTTASTMEIANSWQILAILSIMLSLILVAIAYAVGIGFEMNELQAWAGNELVQVIANALIVGILIAVLAFIEAMVFMVAMQSGIPVPECNLSASNSSASCLQGVTHFYLNDTIDAAKVAAKLVLRNNMDAAGWTGRRFGIYCTTIYCAQIGLTTSFTGQYVLDVDRYNIVFEYYTNLMGFMESQKFFVEQIGFNMGPIILAIGVVARGFFLTRKVGGLLMAIAIGIMFFLPAMYIFDWFTLNLTMNGDKAVEDEDKVCPEECQTMPPVGIIVGGTQPNNMAPNNTIIDENDMYAAFTPEHNASAKGLLNGTSTQIASDNASHRANGLTIKSCSAGDAVNCPTACRELPYPASSTCMNVTVQEACSKVPVQCKVIRKANTSNVNAMGSCPQTCKVIPPLKSNCSIGNCLNSSYDCRRANTTDPHLTDSRSWRPTKPDADADIRRACAYAKNCTASMNAYDSCVYVMPPTGLCSELCPDCPPQCRLTNITEATGPLPLKCLNRSGSYIFTINRNPSNYTVRLETESDTYEFLVNVFLFAGGDINGVYIPPQEILSGNCSRNEVYGDAAIVTSYTETSALPDGTVESITRYTAKCVMVTGSQSSENNFTITFDNRTDAANLSFRIGTRAATYAASCTSTGGVSCTSARSGLQPTCSGSSASHLIACMNPDIKIIEACNAVNCLDICKVAMGELNTLHDEAAANGNCTECPAAYQILASNLPAGYYSGGCARDLCPAQYRAILPRKACERCLFTEEAYIYDPPVNTQCADLCKPSDATPVKNLDTYDQVGADGMVGSGKQKDMVDLAKLMIPIYMLPLFNIVATLVFIKGLSQMLGGDIEIPGLMKVF